MKISYENKELIRQILEVCLNINQYTEHSAFYDFSGHVNALYVRVCESKDEYNNKFYDSDLYMNHRNNDEIYNHLTNLLSDLQEIENGNWEVTA